jgi:hypothetical protein
VLRWFADDDNSDSEIIARPRAMRSRPCPSWSATGFVASLQGSVIQRIEGSKRPSSEAAWMLPIRLLPRIPPDWDGPLAVILLVGISFAVFFICWFLFAKRPTSKRIMNQYGQRHAAADPDRFYDPICGQSHRIFKSELATPSATRTLSTVRALICCFGAARTLCLHMVRKLYNCWSGLAKQPARIFLRSLGQAL